MKQLILILTILFSIPAQAQIMREYPNSSAGTPTRGSNYNDRTTVGSPTQPSSHPRSTPTQQTANSPSARVPNSPDKLMMATTPSGIPLDQPWKVELNRFAIENVVHPAWGYSHAERNYHQTLKIAELEKVKIDQDVLFAASFLHDIGGLPQYEVEGVDHGVRSAEIAIPLLKKIGFPEEKLEAVRSMIIHHIYYGPKPADHADQAFRDADMLDFLGPIGVARLISATSELGKYPSIKNAVDSILQLQKDLPQQFSFDTSKIEAEKRIQEAAPFLNDLNRLSLDGTAY